MTNLRKPNIQGAGGTDGGIGQFFLGIFMMGVGFYMLLSKIVVTSGFGMGYSLYRFGGGGAGAAGGFGLTTGMIFIPMIFGIAWIFYNAKSVWAWMLTLTSLGAMIFGVIASLKIRMTTMSSFDLIVILILAFGGLGFFLRSLKKINAIEEDKNNFKGY